MVWLAHLTRLCALCLLLVSRTYALTADDAPPMRAVPTAIPAQPLPQALAAFSASTRLQLVYVSPLALGKESQAVSAGLPATTSLAQLLEGTGLDFLFLNDHTIKLFERPRVVHVSAPAPHRQSPGSYEAAADSLDEVVVSATKRDEALGSLPMSIRLGVNVRIFVNNATNAQPLLQRYSDAPGSALVYAYTFRPRTLGLMGNWSF
jgi:hypothetical protein